MDVVITLRVMIRPHAEREDYYRGGKIFETAQQNQQCATAESVGDGDRLDQSGERRRRWLRVKRAPRLRLARAGLCCALYFFGAAP